MIWYLKVLKQYADFNGRARRKEYWMFLLFNFIFSLFAISLDIFLGLVWVETGFGPIYLFYSLALFIPGLAVSVRRLHDIGKSGWMVFVSIIPVLGVIWLVVLLAMKGETKPNEYGPVPKKMDSNTRDVLDNELI